jgi:Two component regulator propeller
VNFVLADDTSIQAKTLALDGSPLANIVVQAVSRRGPTRPLTAVPTPAGSRPNAGAAEPSHESLEPVGTLGGVLTRFDGQRFTSYPRADRVGQDSPMWRICLDASGAVWSTFLDGVGRFDGSHWTSYTPTNGLPTNWTGGYSWSLELDSNGAIWAGSPNGVGAARFDGTKFVPFTTNQGLPHNAINSIRRAPDGRLWFATDGGAARFDGQRCTTLTKKDGLAANVVNDIVFSPDGGCWLPTQGGLVRYRSRGIRPYAPSLTIVSDKTNIDLTRIPPITQGTRVTLAYSVVDTDHGPETWQFRRLLLPGRIGVEDLAKAGSWELVTRVELDASPSGHVHLRRAIRGFGPELLAAKRRVPVGRARVVSQPATRNARRRWRGRSGRRVRFFHGSLSLQTP